MSDPNHPCVACQIVSGDVRPAGGVVLDTEHFRVHGINGPTPIAGWFVVTSKRHVRALDDLGPSELSELGPLLAKVMQKQKSALNAEHVYVFVIGDVLHHLHVHLVPRYEETPSHLRGRGAFEAKQEEMLSADVLEEAAKRAS